ncbi:MAG: hypothetical protein JSW52_08940 [Candidatus Coatesbacteria bacterium]|nr:MAG: hypothetical protein JSW52_08940 [Candidatus Coatesbacteria bacterium]
MIEVINMTLLVAVLLLGPIGLILIVVALVKDLIESTLNRSSDLILIGGIASFLLMCISCMLIGAVPVTVEHGTIFVCEKCGSEISNSVEKSNVPKSSESDYEVNAKNGLCEECSYKLRKSAVKGYIEGDWETVIDNLETVTKYEKLNENECRLLNESIFRRGLDGALSMIELGENRIELGEYGSAMHDFSIAMDILERTKNKHAELAREFHIDTYSSKAKKLHKKAYRLSEK